MPKPSQTDLAVRAQMLKAQGRGGDTMLAHINSHEAAMLKRMGGSGKINPKTGLPEFDDGDGGDGGDDGGDGDSSSGGADDDSTDSDTGSSTGSSSSGEGGGGVGAGDSGEDDGGFGGEGNNGGAEGDSGSFGAAGLGGSEEEGAFGGSGSVGFSGEDFGPDTSNEPFSGLTISGITPGSVDYGEQFGPEAPGKTGEVAGQEDSGAPQTGFMDWLGRNAVTYGIPAVVGFLTAGLGIAPAIAAQMVTKGVIAASRGQPVGPAALGAAMSGVGGVIGGAVAGPVGSALGSFGAAQGAKAAMAGKGQGEVSGEAPSGDFGGPGGEDDNESSGNGVIAESAPAPSPSGTSPAVAGASGTGSAALAQALRTSGGLGYDPSAAIFGGGSGQVPRRQVWNKSSLREPAPTGA